MAVQLTDELRKEYVTLFDTCDIRPGKLPVADALTEKIVNNRKRYEDVGTPLSIPWYFIGVVHNMESSLNFKKHLHNGDPLTARTVQVPKGRPLGGSPPFTWEQSATDALQLQRLDKVTDWSMAGILYQMEGYNGWGYRTRHPEVLTPYLWSFSNHYDKGKYVADGRFDPDAGSDQCGAAVILRRLAETGIIQFGPSGEPVTPTAANPGAFTEDTLPMVTYSETTPSAAAESLQRALNAIPGVFLLVDGVAGRRTSDAFKRVTGHFLQGDPRAESATAAGAG